MEKLSEAGIPMNAQIVLCPGYNDGEILENLYQFTYTATKAIDIYVANFSTLDPVDIQYVIANTNLLGSSYVYS
jgi:hypothetical protein